MSKTLLSQDVSSAFAQHPSEFIAHAADLWVGWSRPGRLDWLHQSSESIERTAYGDDDLLLAHLSLATWNDINAYGRMLAWKVWEQAEGVTSAVNSGHLVLAAGAGRGALESTIAMEYLVSRAAETFTVRPLGKLLRALADLNDRLTTSIWGGRAPHAQHQATNILTLRNHVLANSEDNETRRELDRIYALLCDAVHPSSLGHQLYWGRPVDLPAGDEWVVPLDPESFGPVGATLVEPVLWSLGWAIAHTRRSLQYIDVQVERFCGISQRMGGSDIPPER